MAQDKVTLDITINGHTATYSTGSHKLETKKGEVKITCDIPENWSPTRVVQFAESLLKAPIV